MITRKPKGNFNSQFEKQNQEVARDLALKIKLEAGFQKDLRSFFRKLAEKFERAYIESGQVLPANIYQNDLRSLLIKNYKVISKNFDSRLRMSMKNIFWDTEHKAVDSSSVLHTYFREQKQIDQEINSEINSYISRHSEEQAAIITETNQSELGASVNKVVTAAATSGNLLDRTEIAKMATQEFINRTDSRIGTIATTETQTISEYTKLIEANKIENIQSLRGIERSQIRKQWVTVLDERTRFGHVAADGQIQFLKVPFEVSGDKMMAPGDPSLGAKPGNFINCRCSMVYIYPEGNDAPFVDPNQPINASTENFVEDWVDNDGYEWGVTRGYATTYGKPDSVGDIILKEEMDKAIQKLKDDGVEWLPMYYRHNRFADDFPEGDQIYDSTKIIGWFKVDDLISTKTGLYAQGYINKITTREGWGTGTIEEIREGKLRAYSITFTYSKDTSETLPNGNYINRDLTLKEISLVDEPAYPEAVLLPLNQAVRPRDLKPRQKPQKPVTPEAPSSDDLEQFTFDWDGVFDDPDE